MARLAVVDYLAPFRSQPPVLLFNSFVFLLAFLPVTLAGYQVLGRQNRRWAHVWLLAASLLFYGWWDPRYVALLAASIIVNFSVGRVLATRRAATGALPRAWLAAGIGANLALLGWYKYAGFFVRSLATLGGIDWVIPQVVLPLGISFFTFTQVAFLVDSARGRAQEYDLARYALFVTYFPHLIAGPILHHREMMGQLAGRGPLVLDRRLLVGGLIYFVLGLAKKLLIADSLAPHANHGFDVQTAYTVISAWSAILAYTLQLYFDFSGYSDMAIGLSLMFGVALPINFDSPYRARNMIDFWRRWHMSLSAWLRDYLYVPLGGNRRGATRRYVNLFLTMLLGGLWHGAAWTFVCWGALHGVLLAINHAWRACCEAPSRRWLASLLAPLAWPLTFCAVALAWVLFRAQDFARAQVIYAGAFGLNGLGDRQTLKALRAAARKLANAWQAGAPSHDPAALIAALSDVLTLDWGLIGRFGTIGGALLLASLAPNTQALMRYRYAPGAAHYEAAACSGWQPSLALTVFAGLLLAVALLRLLTAPATEFLYFEF